MPAGRLRRTSDGSRTRSRSCCRTRSRKPAENFDDLVERFHLDGTGRLLDLGCGTGQLAIPLAAHVAEAVGMDPETETLVEAARCARAAGVTNVIWEQGGSSQ
ncbi:class I SAM-dependent methyltransferase [Nocardia sp. NPDC059228]|uniref:class I SAM-dependent methyltransferase n=1 Tax=Nocardia sp. NPDC059228 TaxID=3346777 RepID=UPI0036969557